MRTIHALAAVALGTSALLAACGGGGGSSGSTGSLTLNVTDAPVDGANKVVVVFTGVSIKPAGGNEINIDYATPRQIDLLALQGGNVAGLLDGQIVPAGRYEWARLKVLTSKDSASPSYLQDGSLVNHPLYVPSGAETGLKLVGGFTVPANGAASFTIDFDLRKSVVDPQGNFAGGYFLKPALRLVDNTLVGRISGTVNNFATLCPSPNGPTVYVFAGAGVTPDDIDGTAAEPVSTAPVKLDTGTGTYRYTVPFLPAGAYTVSLTCVGATDLPESSEALAFQGTRDAAVTANTVSLQDF